MNGAKCWSTIQRIKTSVGCVRLRVVVIIVMFAALYHVQGAVSVNLAQWNAPHIPSWQKPSLDRDPRIQLEFDLDTWLIHDGLIKSPYAQDTLKWWTGTWVGQVPFYRPLTSIMFWAEWRFFDSQEPRYVLFGVLLHLIAVYQFVYLAFAVFRHFCCPHPKLATLLSGLIFVSGCGLLQEQNHINSEVFGSWKNQPDALCLALFCLSLRLYLGQIGTTLKEQPKQIIKVSAVYKFKQLFSKMAPLLCYLSCCAAKEAGVFLPLLLIVVEWMPLHSSDRLHRGAAWKRLARMLVAMPTFLIFRAMCLKTLTGYTYGSNSGWLRRGFSDAFGATSGYVVAGQWGVLFAGLSLCTISLRLMERYRNRQPISLLSPWRVGVCAVIVVAFIVGLNLPSTSASSDLATRLIVSTWIFWMDRSYENILQILSFTFAMVSAIQRRPLLAAFGYSWALLALGLSLFSPGLLHRFYLVNAGYAIVLAAGFVVASQRCSECVNDFETKR